MSNGIDQAGQTIAEAITKRREILAKNQQARNMETVRDSLVARMSQAGAKEETLDLISKIKAESPAQLITAIKDIQDIMATTPIGIEEKIKLETSKQREIAEARAGAKTEAKEYESSQKLTTAVKRLAIINQQYNEALPSGSNSSAQQRLLGQAAEWGAKTGVAPNPKLLALLSNSRPVAINLIRLFGEVGNLSETEQRGALETVDLKGLTEAERLEKVKQFAEYALAGATPKALESIMKQPDVVETVKNLGIKVPGYEDVIQKPSAQQSFKAGDIREKDGIKYERQEDGTWIPLKKS